VLLFLPVLVGIRPGKFMDAAKMARAIIVLYVPLCELVRRTRVTVRDAYITFGPTFGAGQTKTVPFSDIEESRARMLAEQEHPVSGDIYADTGTRTKNGQIILSLMLSIALKSFGQSMLHGCFDCQR
jgi:hypothetical protein